MRRLTISQSSRRRGKKLLSGIIIAGALLFLAGCSGVTFQPSRKTYYSPEQFGLNHEEVYFKSIDGARLHGWHLPAGPEMPEKGTIIQFHGNAENISTHFMSLVWITKQGYNLFTFDYRGYGRSEGSPSHKLVNGDALAALEYIVERKKRENVGQKPHRIISYGQSLGGTILLRALSELEVIDHIDAVVIESSFLSYREIAAEKLSLSWITWPFQPLAYILFSDRYAPAKTIKNLPSIPVLIIHGDQDLIVPIHHGEKIFSLIKDPKWFWHIKGGKHINSMFVEKGRYRSQLVDFFDQLN